MKGRALEARARWDGTWTTIDQAECERCYARIRDFETQLAESGTTILKFFLHVSRAEQLARFAQRLDDPARYWKISESDYTERERWDDYTWAFEDAISATAAPHAPWYVIPANHEWFCNLVVSQIMADTLADIRRTYHAAVAASRTSKA